MLFGIPVYVGMNEVCYHLLFHGLHVDVSEVFHQFGFGFYKHLACLAAFKGPYYTCGFELVYDAAGTVVAKLQFAVASKQVEPELIR